MDLKTYLEKKNLTPDMFSRVLKVSRSSVYNWIRGLVPHRKVAEKIEKITMGDVKLKDMGHE